ncbi:MULTISPECIES: Bug family tripartite tricarboxylate transporter substrate binding protein [unclassified Variovorax]|uniref:Bug family tripartite tricarboxylate transporter substrate binding protein n=1 Tax=unclassified Variovorax TaxID=663243 RepID=UPI000D1209AE|nr:MULTISPECIES: tripartite tricarboxylate transporter substrate binding protein [unclassified Variovorax]AVQ85418.1 ABC transporter substrate-binding protein [Variovorax sp. PMC12]QRY35040.1 tripartite tricarboxylate transporter substrate binding protein [Variovorax sp. PDNC026]
MHPRSRCARLSRLAVGVALLAAALASHAQDYPTRAIALVVPFPAGSPTDAMAREIGADLRATLGQPVVVENRPGASSLTGTQYVARAAPDGYTLLLMTTSHLINAQLQPKPGYDPFDSFVPVTELIKSPVVFVVRSTLPATNMAQFANYARGRSVSYATWGIGSNTDIYGAMISDAIKAGLLRVPYKGEAPLANDLLGGQVDSAMMTVGMYKAQSKTGKLRALAVNGPKRLDAFPELPTLLESGVPGPSVAGFAGILVPAGTPAAIADKLATHIQQYIQKPEVAARWNEQWGFQVSPVHRAAFGELMRKDAVRWSEAIKSAGIKLD